MKALVWEKTETGYLTHTDIGDFEVTADPFQWIFRGAPEEAHPYCEGDKVFEEGSLKNLTDEDKCDFLKFSVADHYHNKVTENLKEVPEGCLLILENMIKPFFQAYFNQAKLSGLSRKEVDFYRTAEEWLVPHDPIPGLKDGVCKTCEGTHQEITEKELEKIRERNRLEEIEKDEEWEKECTDYQYQTYRILKKKFETSEKLEESSNRFSAEVISDRANCPLFSPASKHYSQGECSGTGWYRCRECREFNNLSIGNIRGEEYENPKKIDEFIDFYVGTTALSVDWEDLSTCFPQKDLCRRSIRKTAEAISGMFTVDDVVINAEDLRMLLEIAEKEISAFDSADIYEWETAVLETIKRAKKALEE